jgi:hypothetical protein
MRWLERACWLTSGSVMMADCAREAIVGVKRIATRVMPLRIVLEIMALPWDFACSVMMIAHCEARLQRQFALNGHDHSRRT